jgi:hypothetical protein
VTTNPEILLAAERDPAYKEALLAADWRTVDGFGLGLVLRLRGVHMLRYTGVDLAEDAIREAASAQRRVALFGGSLEALEGALAFWRAQYPELELRGFVAGAVDASGREDGRTWEARERHAGVEVPTCSLSRLEAARSRSAGSRAIAPHGRGYGSLWVSVGRSICGRGSGLALPRSCACLGLSGCGDLPCRANTLEAHPARDACVSCSSMASRCARIVVLLDGLPKVF